MLKRICLCVICLHVCVPALPLSPLLSPLSPRMLGMRQKKRVENKTKSSIHSCVWPLYVIYTYVCLYVCVYVRERVRVSVANIQIASWHFYFDITVLGLRLWQWLCYECCCCCCCCCNTKILLLFSCFLFCCWCCAILLLIVMLWSVCIGVYERAIFNGCHLHCVNLYVFLLLFFLLLFFYFLEVFYFLYPFPVEDKKKTLTHTRIAISNNKTETDNTWHLGTTYVLDIIFPIFFSF